MKSLIFSEANKIWNKISDGDHVRALNFELEIHKRLLNIFQAGDYYYYIFNVKDSVFELMSSEIESVLGYDSKSIDVPKLITNIHPEDQPWFLNIESKVTDFFSTLPIERICDYKVRYDYRIKKSDGSYIRILQQVITIQHNDTGGVIRTFGVHTDISHLKMEGTPVLSFIGLNGAPSFVDVDIKKVFPLPSEIISKREREILILLAKGKNTKEIANELFISPLTVNKHRQNLLKKTETNNSAELISKCIKKGWI